MVKVAKKWLKISLKWSKLDINVRGRKDILFLNYVHVAYECPPAEKGTQQDLEDFSTGTLCPISEDVIAIHNRTHVKFVFLRTRKSRLLVPTENAGEVACF